ncbi:sulfatase [Colletotrichum graminicola]|uniref:Sulfatase n=1 Tax=Colletotrichum graminicola (strain M1.001 / M2 / FGSC 10212) TaxID=645133 RepID=E3QJH7_COLGM|nr:sulfatase [Colletotrichum graminicola M1.001]EFQ31015.1 sulfatase [Colletotrichum graminicola M1.001]WDK17263.1 sulfatase [Colletotrichum graminicola]
MLPIPSLSSLATLALSATAVIAQDVQQRQPNVVFILTDDQDRQLGSLDYMPYVQKHFVKICCPSRVSLLTGQAAHTTNVTNIVRPHGGYPKFVSQGYNDKYLPVWLQDAGYNTYYTGKLFNAHDTGNWNNPFPKGWTGSDFLLDPNTYLYLNATFQRNQSPSQTFPGEYSNDLAAERVLGFLDDAFGFNGSKPFFLGVAPIGPHNNGLGGETSPGATPPIPAKRHENLFANVTVPRTYNSNPVKLNATEVAYGDIYYHRRLQALQSVDEMVDTIINRLDRAGILNNTYVIFTSDNGFHTGQHRLKPGKTCSIEEDINVPFLIRGPGVPKGKTVDFDFDGPPIPFSEKDIEKAQNDPKHDHVNVEFWGLQSGYDAFGGVAANNTYKAMRVLGDGYSLFYSVWCSNERELYDMKKDPGQMVNLAGSASGQLLEHPLSVVQDRLDALLLVLKSCKAETCRLPWKHIHPEGGVDNLRDALDVKYDEFYAAQHKVSFSSCKDFYDISAEGAQHALTFYDP